jgi:hypothetical protein
VNIEELENGQLAYRDQEGSLLILPMDDEEVRDAFIRRLMSEYVEERDLNELLERFKQSAKDVVDGNIEEADSQ